MPLLSRPAGRIKAARNGQIIFISAHNHIHTTGSRRNAPIVPQLPTGTSASSPRAAVVAPLSKLPLTTVLRSLLINSISSSRVLLPPSLALTTWIANSNGPILSPDRNPLLRYIMKKTFYAQFCAGECPQEVHKSIDSLKKIGFRGVILGYGKEVVLKDDEKAGLSAFSSVSEEVTKREVGTWAEGTLKTVELVDPGDFVAIKLTGAGRQVLYNLSERKPPSPVMEAAMESICQLAVSRGVRLLIDAEQFSLQAGIDDWAMNVMRKYNPAGEPARVLNTYQAYLKSTPATLSRHLRVARDEGFTLGIKLVRGAYIGSDPRHLIHDTKADTDAAYDGIAESVLRRQWLAPLDQSEGAMPSASLVLASHNAASVRKARAIVEAGEARVDVAFGQLKGMADEISCELLCNKDVQDKTKASEAVSLPASVNAVKYLVWGSTGECTKYLLRRAHENRDAVQRTKEGRDALRAELWRRTRVALGLRT